MDAPSITEIKSIPGESLWNFISQLPQTMEAQIFYALLIGSCLGLFGHYFKQWSEGGISGNLFTYLFRQNPRRSMLSLFGIITWSLGEVSTGLFVSDAGVFVGWALVILSGLKTGYAGDSLLNKGGRAEWTEEQRLMKSVHETPLPESPPTTEDKP